jgi:hypothetical protein
VDHDLIDRWILDRYTSIIDALNWPRREARTVIQTVEPYADGTVAITAGTSIITGTSTVWTAGHTGERIRIGGRNEFYTFTRASGTTGTIDRPYEGATETEAAYRIYKSFYTLPADCRILNTLTSLQMGHQLEERSLPDVNSDGEPLYYRKAFDSASQVQVELYPAPSALYSYEANYTAEETTFNASAATLLVWLRPGALIQGVYADGLRHKASMDLGNANALLALAVAAERRHDAFLSDMIKTAAANMPCLELKLPSRYTPNHYRR